MSNLEALVAQKGAREGKRYRNKEIAEALEVSESTISRLMKGQDIEGTTLRVIVRLCEWLNCDPADLIYLDRSPAE